MGGWLECDGRTGGRGKWVDSVHRLSYQRTGEAPSGGSTGGWMVRVGRTDAANGWIMCTGCRRRGCGDAIWWFYGWVDGHSVTDGRTDAANGWILCTGCRRRGYGDAIWWFYGRVEDHTAVTNKTEQTGGFSAHAAVPEDCGGAIWWFYGWVDGHSVTDAANGWVLCTCCRIRRLWRRHLAVLRVGGWLECDRQDTANGWILYEVVETPSGRCSTGGE